MALHANSDPSPVISERVVPFGAGISAVSTLLSCLPLSVASAIGAVTLSTALRPFRTWLVGLSIVLLTIAFVQVYRLPPARRRWSTLAILAVSVLFVALVLLSQL